MCRIKQIIFNKYETNLKTTISQRNLRVCSLFEFNHFSLLIDNIIYASGTLHTISFRSLFLRRTKIFLISEM